MDIIKAVDGPNGIFADAMPVASGDAMIKRAPNDPAWRRGGLWHDDMPINIPGLWFMSWYDAPVGPNIAMYNHVLVLRPVSEGEGRSRDGYDPQGALLPHGAEPVAHVGNVAAQRRVADDIPPRQQRPRQHAQWRWCAFNDATKKDKPDLFAYDPMKPVNSYGGNVCCQGNAIVPGSLDQRKMEARFDRNLNTGGNNYDETKAVVAHNVVHHSAQYPSTITVTVVKKPAAIVPWPLVQRRVEKSSGQPVSRLPA